MIVFFMFITKNSKYFECCELSFKYERTYSKIEIVIGRMHYLGV